MAKDRNTRKKPQIQITGFLENEKQNLARKVKKLGGSYLESTSFIIYATHIICDKVSRKEKFLCGCASGKWVLTADYINESFKAGHWIEEETFEWTPENSHPSTPSELASLPRKYREQIRAKGKPFSTWTVLMILTQATQMRFKRLLEAGGAKIINAKMPWKGEILRAVNFAFVDDEFKKEIKVLLRSQVLVLSPEYITEYLIKSPPPSVELFKKGIHRKMPAIKSPRVLVEDVVCKQVSNGRSTKPSKQLTINELWKRTRSCEGKFTILEDRDSHKLPSRDSNKVITSADCNTKSKNINSERVGSTRNRRKRGQNLVLCRADIEKENARSPIVLRHKQRKMENKISEVKHPSTFDDKRLNTTNGLVCQIKDGPVADTRTNGTTNSSCGTQYKSEKVYCEKKEIEFSQRQLPVKAVDSVCECENTVQSVKSYLKDKMDQNGPVDQEAHSEATISEGETYVICKPGTYKTVPLLDVTACNSLTTSNQSRVDNFSERLESAIHLEDREPSVCEAITLKEKEKSVSNQFQSEISIFANGTSKINDTIPDSSLPGSEFTTCKLNRTSSEYCDKKPKEKVLKLDGKLDDTKTKNDTFNDNRTEMSDTIPLHNNNKYTHPYTSNQLYTFSSFRVQSSPIKPRKPLPSALTHVIEGVLQEKGCSNGLEQCQGVLSQQHYFPASLLREIITIMQSDSEASTMAQAHNILQKFKMFHPPNAIRQVYSLALQYPVVLENGEIDGVLTAVELLKIVIRDVVDASVCNSTEVISVKYLASKQLLCYILSTLEEDLNHWKSKYLMNSNAEENPLVWEMVWDNQNCDCHCSNVDDIVQIWIDSLQSPAISILTPLIKMIADCCAIFDLRVSSNYYGTASSRLVHLIASKIGIMDGTVYSSSLRITLSQFAQHWLALRLADHLFGLYDFSSLASGARQYLQKPLSLEKVLKCYCTLYPSTVNHPVTVVDTIPANTKDSTSRSSGEKIMKNNRIHAINKRNMKGETKLHLACIKNQPDKIRELLSLGVDANVTDNAGWTPLHEACNRGNLECAKELLKHKDTDVFIVGPSGLSVLHDAVLNGRVDVAKLLVNAGGEKLMDLRSSSGLTAWEMCSPRLKDEIVLCSIEPRPGLRKRDFLPDHVIKRFMLLIGTLIRGCCLSMKPNSELNPVHNRELLEDFKEHVKSFCTAQQLRKHKVTFSILKGMLVFS